MSINKNQSRRNFIQQTVTAGIMLSNPVQFIFMKNNNDETLNSKISIRVGASSFTATLSENAAVAAFKGLLPMTIKMIELNGNEKYFDLPTNVPTNKSKPSIIKVGDLMLYGANTLVLFYKSFSTPYNYTKLGSIDDTTGLAAALGKGNVSVSFEI
jgi:hypothetical protein